MREQRIIVIDGIDGAGKTSLIQKLGVCLDKVGVTTKAITLKNRDSAIVKYYNEYRIFPENQFMKLSAYMFDLLSDIEALRNMPQYDYILFDRYIDCLEAYFGSLDIHIPWVSDCNNLIPHPHCTYILDLSVDLALERIDQRVGERKDLENKAFLSKVREKYLNIAKEKEHKILDASLDSDILCEIILADLNVLP